MRFHDRFEAGERLAEQLTDRLTDVPAGLQVLALPRGGVPVARPVADALGVGLRVLLVRKLGVPGHEELAMGAVAAIGDRIRTVRNETVLQQIEVDDHDWQRVHRAETAELQRRMIAFAEWTATEPAGAPVVLVDDGLATGTTMQAAVACIAAESGDQQGDDHQRGHHGLGDHGPGDRERGDHGLGDHDRPRDSTAGAGSIMVAVPVGASSSIEGLRSSGIEVVCLSRPDPLTAVGASYRDFHQLDDDEVIRILRGGSPPRD